MGRGNPLRLPCGPHCAVGLAVALVTPTQVLGGPATKGDDPSPSIHHRGHSSRATARDCPGMVWGYPVFTEKLLRLLRGSAKLGASHIVRTVVRINVM